MFIQKLTQRIGLLTENSMHLLTKNNNPSAPCCCNASESTAARWRTLNPQTGNTGVHLRNIRFATKGLNQRLDLLFFRLA